MGKNNFLLAIERELRKVEDFSITAIYDYLQSSSDSILVTLPGQREISMGKCRNTPTGVYYFYQDGKFTKYWYQMNGNEPFLVIDVSMPSEEVSVEDVKHVVYLHLPEK